MTIVVAVLVVLVVLGAAAAVGLAMDRSRLAGRLGTIAAELEGAKREREDARAEVVGLRAELKRAVEEGSAARVRAGELAQELESERRAGERALSHAEEVHERELETLREQCALEMQAAEKVYAERLAAVERVKEELEKQLGEMKGQMQKAFGALAAEALKQSGEQFLTLAEQKLAAKTSAVDALVKPIAETLKKTDEKLAVIEAAGSELRMETGKLVRALREPHVRGRYGEIQLQRVAELAGMSRYCDFTPQDQTRSADGTALRPDMIVRLPSSRTVVVDAKTNIQCYLDAVSAATPEEAERCLEKFARHVADQAMQLARKKYWAQYDGSPEFVVMFIPGDQFIDAALARQPDLIERAAEQGVILASPSTLIGLLRAVAVGYREQQLAQAAEELRDLGKQLHERVAIAMEHFRGLGDSLRQSVERYNDFVGSYERRLEPVLRRFEDGGVKSGKTLPAVETVEMNVRRVDGQLRLME